MSIRIKSQRKNLLVRLRHITGLDGAITYTVLARCFQILGSTGTVLLIARFLSPSEQGYYYTILSLVALQTVFELGFSFVILQLAAHESVSLTANPDGTLGGDRVALARVASVLQKSTKWYLNIAVAMGAILMPLGFVFFSRNTHSTEHVSWQLPWLLAVCACVAAFFLGPLFAFLEGCGQVRQVARMRFEQAVVAVIAAWSGMICHRGLYSPALVLIGYTAIGILFLFRRRKLLSQLLSYPVNESAVSWRTEVWCFQWKIAVSWLCSYFTLQCLTPLLFAYRGPIEAGKLGMSISIAGYLWNVVLPWVSTKAAPFGQMIAAGEFGQLDRLFFRTLWQSLVLLFALVSCLMFVILRLPSFVPKLAARLLPPELFGLLLLATISTYIVQSLAIYLRAHKSEPLLLQSVAVALTTVVGAFLCIPKWGMAGAATTYFLCTGIVGLSWAIKVFINSRNTRSQIGSISGSVSIIRVPAQIREERI